MDSAAAQSKSDTLLNADQAAFDYSRVNVSARIACYDDKLSSPRITDIEPAETSVWIATLASTVYEQANDLGGTIPFTVIKEVIENFIHAQFREIVVSIFDDGCTIRFSDQGPGIEHKDKAVRPGFTSATKPMKQYIRGVGSGLTIVSEYMGVKHGNISIEDNLETGTVVTISLQPQEHSQGARQNNLLPECDVDGHSPSANSLDRQHPDVSRQSPGADVLWRKTYEELDKTEKNFLYLLLKEGDLGVSEFVNLLGTPNSSTHTKLTKLEQKGLVSVGTKKKRTLTALGRDIAAHIPELLV